MAHRSNQRHPVYGLALIALCILVHYGWAWVPAEHQAQVFNAAGAFARLVGVCIAAWFLRSTVARLVALWWACEELMVIGCSSLYIVSPWEVLPGQAQCSALLQFDLGRIGLALAVFVLVRYVNSDSVQCNKGGG